MILLKFTVSFKNEFSGLFFHKQKCKRVFQAQKDINVVVIIHHSYTEP